ncbi:MAG: hypothetical protein Q8N51_04665 [Gammaproteobacteria bacterium]|nr:hypothetical protein [Gammaproteobacteria bacterium]
MVTQRPTQLPLSARARMIALWLLTAALLYAQAVGAMHRVVHAHLLQPAPAAAHQDARTAASTSVDASGWQAILFSGHEENSTCRVFDATGYGDGATVLPSILGQYALPRFLPCAHARSFRFSWTAPFDARGPPVAR